MRVMCPECRERIEVYIDEIIRNWRRGRELAGTHDSRLAAECYVDAFQSIRMALLGSLLPVEKDKNKKVI